MESRQSRVWLLILVIVYSDSADGLFEILLNRAVPWLEKESFANSFYLDSKISLLSLDSALEANISDTIIHSPSLEGSSSNLNDVSNLSENLCAIHLQYIIEKLWTNRGDAPILAFIDSFAKPPPSIMDGNLNWHGDKIQCASTEIVFEPGSRTFGGKYCKAEWNTTFYSGYPLRHYTGVCMPSACKEEDFRLMKAFLEKFFFLKISEQSRVIEIECEKENQITTDLMILYSVIFGLTVLGILSTIYDRCSGNHTRTKNPDHSKLPVLSIFSIPRNMQSLNGERVSKNDILIVHYIRGILILLVVIGHCVGILMVSFALVPGSIAISIDTFGKFWLLPRTMMTVFFFLTGFLIHSDFTSPGQNLYPLQMILKAFLRLSPSYYFAIFTHTSFISTVGLGSKMDVGTVLNGRYQCYNVIWEHLFYFHNSLHATSSCNFVFWSMAITFQLYVVGVFVAWLLVRSPITGIATGALLTLYGSALSIKAIHDAELDYLIGLEEYPITYRYLEKSIWNTITFFSDFYTQTSPWLCTVMMGILFAYFLPKWQLALHPQRKKIAKIISASSIIFYLIFGLVASLKQSYLTYSLLQTFSPVGMGLILSLLIFVFHPQSQLIGYRLSPKTCPILVHFSRLSYPLYLTHWTVLMYILNTTSITPLLDKFSILCTVCGCLVLVYIVSIFLYIFIERPIQNIRKTVGM